MGSLHNGNKFNSRSYIEKFVIDIYEAYYTNWSYQLIGISCKHAYVCLFFIGKESIDDINFYYPINTYKAYYAPIVNLINGENM